ncbi:uncharacterized protein B0H18DRAFT_329513 [Fomitopsis serialis]|uniref:uncharacterized protein n=1 Tax=Fomitopsis serialis TaxID=139415 RepID=UPI002007E947|nr:uncharacterized protein B0H18DRAFT_329513 [Neoantrodia serialis]KAH9926671.1 hypothetical protein B0H18DRAFT_329513 [Neoantrodia serialis]
MSAVSGTPVLNTKRTNDTFIAVKSAEILCPSVPRTNVQHGGRQNTTSLGPGKKSSHKGPRADRGESLLDRLDAILAQEPTFVTPEDPTPFPFIAADPTRRSRVMSMLDDIIVQGPPPLSPASEYDSDASSTDSPLPATPPTMIVADHGFLPPLDLASLLRLSSPDQQRRVVLLPESSPPRMQEYLVWPVKKTLSKITGRGAVPPLSPPAIILEDTDVGELPLQTPDCSSLFPSEVSPEVDYLQPPPPSWNAPVEETVQPVVCVPRRIVRPTCVRGPTPFLKPRRSQLRGQPIRPAAGERTSLTGPGIGLGLSVPRNPASLAPSVINEEDAHLSVPPRAIAAARPAHRAASLYPDYF